MSVVFHIATRAEWQRALAAGAYRTGSLDSEGFIHCSTAEQVVGTADRLFAGRTDLVLLFIDGERLTAVLRHEAVADPPGAEFPHVFGPIDLDAVFEVAALEPGDGRFGAPPAVIALGVVGGSTMEQAEARAMAAMAGCRTPWWVAGGWALELHAAIARDRRIRPHADLEIAILRRDQRALFDHLAGWQLCAVVGPGVLEDWDGRTLPADVHQIWARCGAPRKPDPHHFAADPTLIEILLEEAEGDRWRFRRRLSISCPIAKLGSTGAGGVPFIRPEVALLYKAKHLRFKDQRDFDASAPSLDATARMWLAAALEEAHPGHPWGPELERL
jgi:uncharacterized protein (DUF952 family)